jgi:hypothetical protein
MLAGRYPFDGANDAARLIRILGTDGPDPLPDSVTPAVRDVVLRALSKDPDLRFETAAELASALEVSKLPATHREVAQFFNETLARSIKSRHSLVEHALAAADARARAREMLDGPMTGSTSYRPPPVIADLADAPTVPPLGGGTLGTVTHTKSSRPPARAWMPWATAGVIAIIVVIAFALGSLSARGPARGPIVATPANASAEASAYASAEANAKADTKAKAEADANANEKARAKAEQEAADAKAAAETKLAAETKAADAKAAAAKAPKYFWPPRPAVSAAPVVKTVSSAKPATKKPPEKEDTIY